MHLTERKHDDFAVTQPRGPEIGVAQALRRTAAPITKFAPGLEHPEPDQRKGPIARLPESAAEHVASPGVDPVRRRVVDAFCGHDLLDLPDDVPRPVDETTCT